VVSPEKHLGQPILRQENGGMTWVKAVSSMAGWSEPWESGDSTRGNARSAETWVSGIVFRGELTWTQPVARRAVARP